MYRIISLNNRQLYEMGWGGDGGGGVGWQRSFCMLMSLKRRVRVDHGRVARPKPNSFRYSKLNIYCSHSHCTLYTVQ
jgi:hypothetical protein